MTKRSPDITYLRRALRLGLRGRGSISPHPRVGAILLDRWGKVVGEGWHAQFGGPHAEFVALQKAKNWGADVRGGTLYVSLEPCSHYGKTPPCTEAIINAGISRVVFPHLDPNPLVNGKGMAQLQEGGIQVECGGAFEEALYINRGYMTANILGRAWCTAKVALTLDGKMASREGRSRWITGEKARRLAHQLRADHDAVLVGATTARFDDPELTVRMVKGHNPIRIVLSRKGDISYHSKLVRTSSQVPTWIVTSNHHSSGHPFSLPIKVLSVERREQDDDVWVDPEALLIELSHQGILSLLIEGGSQVLSHFLKKEVIDELFVAYAPSVMGAGLAPFDHYTLPEWDRKPRFKVISVKKYGEDVVIHYLPIGGTWEKVKNEILRRMSDLAVFPKEMER